MGTGEGEAAGGESVASDDEEDGGFSVSGADGDALYLDLDLNMNSTTRPPSGGSPEDGFDLSRFLGAREQMRVVLWKEL